MIDHRIREQYAKINCILYTINEYLKIESKITFTIAAKYKKYLIAKDKFDKRCEKHKILVRETQGALNKWKTSKVNSSNVSILLKCRYSSNLFTDETQSLSIFQLLFFRNQ